MTTKQFFLYYPASKLFAGTYEAHASPEEQGKYIAPDHSTPHPVPVLAANEAALFDVAADAWTVVPDFSGQLFYDQNSGAEIVIDQHGPVPVGLAKTKPVSAVRGEVWEKIKEKRSVIMAGGVKVGADWFHSDESSRIQQLGLKDEVRDMLAAGAKNTDQLVIDGAQVLWKTMSGAFVPMTAQLALDIVAAVKVLDKRAHAAAETHRAAMGKAADPSAYDFSAGWPVTFPG